ncbi:MAG: endosialidase [Lachnospiraceae bacterium]|jgi:hypothetical protein|nr:endosialidase [Lachnospiraceae bacterium]MCX4315478.1 endosialidase [Lachnospiraceae bacterium]
MAVVEELIRSEEDGTLSFGNFTLPQKSKVNEFEHGGDIYKVKTYNEITKLEKNGMFVYESVPGTAVFHFEQTETSVSFQVEASEDVQITLGMEEEKEYKVFVDQTQVGKMKTGLGGKLTISVEMEAGRAADVTITEA